VVASLSGLEPAVRSHLSYDIALASTVGQCNHERGNMTKSKSKTKRASTALYNEDAVISGN
jgi:hypothetical protein